MACGCGEEHKYTCPACGYQFCSAKCCKDHKIATKCTGELDPTRFVPKGELLTPTGLDRDYNFLQRMGRDIQLEHPEFKRRARDYERNNVKIRAMPPQMSRAKQNKSGFNRAKQCYLWSVEVKEGSESRILHVSETDTITQVTGAEQAVLVDADGKRWKAEGTSLLKDVLHGKSVVEFPTFILGVDVESESESDSDSDSDSESDSDSSDSDSESAPEEESSKAQDEALMTGAVEEPGVLAEGEIDKPAVEQGVAPVENTNPEERAPAPAEVSESAESPAAPDEP